MLLYKNGITLETIVFLYLVGAFINILIIFPWKNMININITNFSSLPTLKNSSSYALLIFTSYFYARGDHLIIKYLLNSYALGIYSSAYRYLEALSIIPTALTHNLFPISAKITGISQRSLKKIFLISGLVGIIIGSALFFLSRFLIVNLIGLSYQSAILPLRIFSLVVFMFFLNAPLSTVVQSSDWLKKFLPYGVGNTVLNLVLNIIFVPVYGIKAAAWVMLLTEITGLLINIFFVIKLYSRKPLSCSEVG